MLLFVGAILRKSSYKEPISNKRFRRLLEIDTMSNKFIPRMTHAKKCEVIKNKNNLRLRPYLFKFFLDILLNIEKF